LDEQANEILQVAHYGTGQQKLDVSNNF